MIPIVFYTGEGRWAPAKNISDKIDYAKGFEKYTPKYEYFVVELSQLDKDWLLKVETILSKLLYMVKAEDMKEIFKELKAEVDKLDKDKREKFYSYLKSLLIGSGLSVKEATETVQELEEEGEGRGMIKILEKERKEGKA